MASTTPLALADKSIAFLEKVLAEAWQRAPENDLRQAFVYRHTRNISDLAADVLALEAQHRSSSSRIVVRPMIESLFKLTAAVKNTEFAVEKLVAEVDDEVERIRKWIDVVHRDQFEREMSETIAHLTEYAQKLRQDYGITSRNRWNVFDTARVAALEWHYAQDYFLSSEYVHATISGIVSQEFQVGRGHTLQTAIFVMLSAVGHAVQLLETSTPQAHIDEAARLMGIMIHLVQQGAFRDNEEA